MSEAKIGDEFVTHEFDEAIAIQRSIVEAGEALATTHPMPSAKRALKAAAAEDRKFLRQLETMGKTYDATGKVEDVAAALNKLMSDTLSGAGKDAPDSEFYEAHAVLLTLKRKQMDGAGGMRRIATAIKDPALRAASIAFERAQRSSSVVLSRELAAFARKIAAAPAA